VFEHGSGYICEKATGAARTCDFRSGRIILQQEVSREQMVKLLSEGRTDLLTGFVSNRTRRSFKAFLVKQPDGKIGFEFMQRAAKAPAKGAAAKAEEPAPAGKVYRAAAKNAANDPLPPTKAVAKKAARKVAGVAAKVPAKKAAAKKPAAKKAVRKAA
jgi:DNA topoisomerase-3